jgi:polysaccharide deacetylase family protein (PEP-CTERM system associated)
MRRSSSDPRSDDLVFPTRPSRRWGQPGHEPPQSGPPSRAPGPEPDRHDVSLRRADMAAGLTSPKRHLLTVALEDYYHVSSFRGIIERGQWSRFERRLEIGTERTLALLAEREIRATFFVLGWVADTVPELVRRVAEAGHEIASKGYYPRSIQAMAPQEFRDDLARAREALERASGQDVIGYRVAERSFERDDLWALDVLAEAGYLYDSSIKPILRAYAGEPWRRFAHQHRSAGRSIWEFPPSAVRVLGMHVPIAGGNYFRQFPHALVKRAVAHWDRTQAAPFVMYFHTWELDPQQPRISAAPLLAQIRQYRNLDKMEGILRDYFSRYRFEGIADHLGVDPRRASSDRRGPGSCSDTVPAGLMASASLPPSASGNGTAPDPIQPVSVVIPCCNEELALPYLFNTLLEIQQQFAGRYCLRFIFVDDGSTDATADLLRRHADGRANCSVVRHERNQGVTAAIMTGMRKAETDIVCSIDCDCTYDPHQLGAMIPLLTDGVDLITASPYHSQGRVRNVQGWRLTLSRSASALYRVVLRQKLQTYTSCFRVYRRSAILELDLREPGYLGIVELLGKLDLRGSKVLEHPSVLEARLLGRSKMKIIRNIVGHLGLLGRLALLRVARRLPRPWR